MADATDMTSGKQSGTPVNLGSKVVGEIELPTIDVTQYVGRKVPVERVEEYEGDFGYFVKMTSAVIDAPKDKATGEAIKSKDGKAIELRATRIFGLQENAKGELGWGKQTKLGVFLAKHKVKHYKEMAGKEVIVQTITKKEDGKDYLTF